jgi:lipid-A-disaccharide synthase
MKKYIDQSISIFSFEQNWYNHKGLETDYVGHPFADIHHLDESSKEYYKRHDLDISKPILVLLPGSRQQEINRHWDIILDAVSELLKINKDIQVVIGKSKNILLDPIPNNFKLEENSKKAIISATAAITCSGTATLECAVEDTPMVVCYKLSTISWYIAKIVSKVNYSSIVNLILNKKAVPELLQNEMNSNNIVKEIMPLLDLKSFKRKKMLSDFNEIRKTLGVPGVYERSASLIISKTKSFNKPK